MPFLRQKKTAGFTMVELMVVITIIGLLASVVLASLTDTRARARDAQRVQMVKELQKALELYRNANGGNYPCQTTPPGCASGGGQVNTNGSASTTVFNNALSPYITMPREMTTFSSSPTWGSIIYRTGGTTPAPIRDSYTILLRREQVYENISGATIPAGIFCKITAGSNTNTTWDVYTNCF